MSASRALESILSVPAYAADSVLVDEAVVWALQMDGWRPCFIVAEEGLRPGSWWRRGWRGAIQASPDA